MREREMRNGLCHPERAQIPSERSESRNRHPLASRDLHLVFHAENADNDLRTLRTALPVE